MIFIFRGDLYNAQKNLCLHPQKKHTMALITDLTVSEKEKLSVHEPVHKADYSTFQDQYGNNYLEIRTYGSASRESSTASQTIQFSPKIIEQLKAILAGL